MKIKICFIALTLITLLPWSAQGQNPSKEESIIPTVKIVLHPMPEPRPALKYQLVPPLIDRIPGNAAVLYNRSTAEASGFFGDGKMWEIICDLLEAPLPEMRKQNVRQTVNSYKWLMKNFIRAGRCEYCDWQLPIREQDFWEISLEEAQQSRSYAWLLALKARLQIADGQYDEAVQTLQAGYALSRHVSSGQTLIHGLIGTTIAEMMSNQVRELIQQPGTPNLYWALSTLPRPLVNFRPGIEAEHDAFYLSFPELKNLDKKQLSPEEWRSLLAQTVQKIARMGAGSSNPDLAVPLTAVLLLEKYPRAKSFLIERGWPADKVEAMPVCQVALIAALRQYDELRDDIFKWMYLPYGEASPGIKKANAQFTEFCRSGQEILPIGSIISPAVGAVKNAEVRGERQIAALRVLEAIRLYGASHDGQLPEKLSDITEVPIPLDPLYGAPFIYYCQGKTAYLESPPPRGMAPQYYHLRYEIQFESKGK
jgi:hypothetical protein